MKFINDEVGLKLYLPNNIYKDMKKICEDSHPRETGGIIIGYYTDSLNEIIITEISKPTSDSKLTKTNFYRGVKDLEKNYVLFGKITSII